MAKQKLSLDTVEMLAPPLRAQFDAMLKRLVNDCRERPLETGNRVLTIEFNITPKLHSQSANTECDNVELDVRLKSKVPQMKSRAYELTVHASNEVSFNPDLPDDPEGESLYNADEAAADKRSRRS